MEPIFPITALSKQQSQVKEAAQNDIVRITEHGTAAWIFTSEKVYEKKIEEAVSEALEEAQIQWIIERGIQNFAEGKFIEGTDNAKAALAAMRNAK